jgi:hypothetical protein
MKVKEKELEKLLEGTELEGLDFMGFETAEELIDNMNTQIDETEVIYYSNAIKYLSENDASLNESIGIASELGYEAKNINSELLATLLQQQNMRIGLSKLENEIKDIYA